MYNLERKVYTLEHFKYLFFCFVNHNIPASTEAVSKASMLKDPSSNPGLAFQLFLL